MVSCKVLDKRGVREERDVLTRDMDNLADRLAELLSTLQVLADRARGNGDLDMHFVLGAASRLLFGTMRDLIEIDEVLRQRGAIVDAHAYLRRSEQPVSHLDQELQ